MEKYELKNKYEYEEDEIDLVELLKSIIRERKLVIIITILFTILAFGFAFYKSNKPYNYGVEISLSEHTKDKINQYNASYKNSSVILNQTIQNTFDSLLDKKNPNVITLNSEDEGEIKEVLKEEYNFVKIIDSKNKTYKLFTKTKNSQIENLSKEINKMIAEDVKNLNSEFEKNLSENIISAEKELSKLTEETNKLNKNAMEIIKENFSDISKENISSNFSIISPVLYVEYQEKINSLNNTYLKVIDLNKIKNEPKKLFELSGQDNITIIKFNSSSETSGGLNSKLIIAIGIIFGLFAGMFIAIVKEPLKNILKEIKEEK